MRPVLVSQSAAGASAWVPVAYSQNSFALGLGVVLSTGANLTCAVEHTFDNLDPVTPVTISRTTTTATVTHPAHGLLTNDSAVIAGTGSSNFDGQRTITVVDANTYTYTVSNAGDTSASGFAASGRVFTHLTLTGLTARADGNYAFPVRAVRLRNSAYVSGTSTLIVLSGSTN